MLNSGIIFYEKYHFILSKSFDRSIKNMIAFTFQTDLTVK